MVMQLNKEKQTSILWERVLSYPATCCRKYLFGKKMIAVIQNGVKRINVSLRSGGLFLSAMCLSKLFHFQNIFGIIIYRWADHDWCPWLVVKYCFVG